MREFRFALTPLLGASAVIGLLVSGCHDDQVNDPNVATEIDTILTPSQVVAGTSTSVTCVGNNFRGEPVAGVVWAITASPTEGLSANGTNVTPTKTGVYQIACVVEGGAADPTPAELTVTAGPAATTSLTVEPATTVAGEPAALACIATDAFGNVVEGAAQAVTSPTEGVTLSGNELIGTVVGEYEVGCSAPGVAEASVAPWTVVAGPVVNFAIGFDPDRLAYRLNQTITVVGRGTDAFGNAVPDSPVTNVQVAPSGNHEVTGDAMDKLRFSLEGKYTVTAEHADVAGLTASAPLVVDQTPPVLVLTAPEHGLVVDNPATVQFEGTVTDNLGEVGSLMIGETLVPLPPAGGAFSVAIPVGYGGNLFGIEALDPYDNLTRATRSIEKSSAYIKMDVRDIATDGVDNALVLVLLQEAFDDLDHTEPVIDDLSHLFEVVIASFDIGALLPNPLTTFSCIGGDCELSFTDFTIGNVAVNLQLKGGRIGVSVALTDVAAEITLLAPCSLGILCASDPLPLPGTVEIESLVITTDLGFAVSGGQTSAFAENTAAEITGFGVDINDPTGLLQGLINGAIVFIESGLTSALEAVFVGLIENELAEVMSSLFDALVLDTLIEVPSPVDGQPGNNIQIKTEPSGMEISGERLQLRLRGLAIAENAQRPYPSLGSLDHTGCSPASAPSFPPGQPMNVNINDGFINQLAYAVWEGGTISLNLGPGEADALVGDFGIEDMDLEVQAHLPPLLNSCQRENDVLQIGDLFLDAEFMLLGQPMKVGLWLATEAAVDLNFAVSDEGILQAALVLGDLDPLFIEVITNEGIFEDDEQALRDLLTTQLVPQLLATIGDAATFDLPSINLGELVPGFGEELILNLDVRQVIRDNAYLSIQGTLGDTPMTTPAPAQP